MCTPGLGENGSAANNGPTGTAADVRRVALDGGDQVAEAGAHLVGITELWWDHGVEAQGGGHEAVGSEEVPRPVGDERAILEKGPEAMETRPVMHAFDEMVLDGVRGGAGKLGEDIGRVNETHEARRFARPEVLPATSQGVLRLGDELVEMLGELDDGSMAVEEHGVVMVGHHDGQDHIDAKRWAASARQ